MLSSLLYPHPLLRADHFCGKQSLSYSACSWDYGNSDPYGAHYGRNDYSIVKSFRFGGDELLMPFQKGCGPLQSRHQQALTLTGRMSSR